MSPARFDGTPVQPVIRRLDALRRLSPAAAEAIDRALRDRIQRVGAGQDLMSEGDRPERVRIVLSGWLCRYKVLEDGRRQIVNFVLPGETCDAYGYLLPQLDHSIGTLTPVVNAELERAQFEELVATDNSLAEAFQCETLANTSIQREWAVNIGRRMALERVAHLLCEIVERLRPVGLLEGNSCPFPPTQMDMADATGLSVVHLNRTLQELRAASLIVLRERILTVNDLDTLKNIGLFNPNYLHYGR
jgi:CRP-like cAMP-binding protein